MAEPHVVILGAGFAGIGAAQKLHKMPVQMTLIDKHDYHTFQPLLYQVATDELAPTEVGYPIREILHKQHNLVFHQATVTGLDLAKRQVAAEGMDPIAYDYLVLGLGAVVNFFDTPGAAEHAFPLYTLQDAINLQRHILQVLEGVDKNPSLVQDGALTFVVVGGGATGVEVAGAMATLFQGQLERDYPNLPMDAIKLILVELAPSLLPPFKPNLQAYAKEKLEEMGVKVCLGESVVAVEAERVHLKSGEVIPAHTVIWGAGLQANPLVRTLGIGLARGARIEANPDLSLKDHPEVYIAGDIGLITDVKTNKQLPQLGSVAQQAGRVAGENIGRAVRGQPTKPFEYLDKGMMAMIGRGAAVAELPVGERTMSGHMAWMGWLGVHLVLMSGGEERVSTLVDWGWTGLTRRRSKGITVD
jgi:NADH:ubiquinone reductase (H+-translocating)